MEIEKIQIGTITQITFKGRLDANSSTSFGDALASALTHGERNLRLDLGGVHYLSSAAIRVLISFYKLLKDLGGSMMITEASPTVSNVMEMAGFGSLLDFESAAGHHQEVPGDVLESDAAKYEVYDSQHPAELELSASGARVPGGADSDVQKFPDGVMGFGVGRFANAGTDIEENGRFFAVAGVGMVEFPKGGVVDYFSTSGILVPEIEIQEGLLVHGAMSRLLRFEAKTETGVGLDDLLETCVRAMAGDRMAFLIMGEAYPLPGENQRHALINVKTGQAPFLVLGGVACPVGTGALEDFLRPNVEVEKMLVEVVAVRFGRHLVKTGRLTPREVMESLLESENPQRMIVPHGKGNAALFRRGLIWCGAVESVRMEF